MAHSSLRFTSVLLVLWATRYFMVAVFKILCSEFNLPCPQEGDGSSLLCVIFFFSIKFSRLTMLIWVYNVMGIQWTRELSIISSIEQASPMRHGKHYRYFEAGPTSMDPLSCSVCHAFLIQCCNHYLPPVSLTPVANLPPASLIPVATCHRYQQY